MSNSKIQRTNQEIFQSVIEQINKTYTADYQNILEATVRSIADETLYIFNNNIIPYCQKSLQQ